MIEIKANDMPNDNSTEVIIKVDGEAADVTAEMVAILDAIAKNKRLDLLWLTAMQMHMDSLETDK